MPQHPLHLDNEGGKRRKQDETMRTWVLTVLEGFMKTGQKYILVDSKKGTGKAPTAATMRSTVDKWSGGPKPYIIVKSMRQA